MFGRGNWRNEAMETAAVRQARVNERERVLWPGMEGLGMHRLHESAEDVQQEQPQREETGVAVKGAEKVTKEAGPLWRKK